MTKEKTSSLQGFHSLSPSERLNIVKEFAGLDDSEAALIAKEGGLDNGTASRMIENVIGQTQLPFGIATNFLINGKDYLVPMCLEEPSVVAGASKSAKLAREGGGFTAKAAEPVMIGQLQIVDLRDPAKSMDELLSKKAELLMTLEGVDPILAKYGGGPRDIKARVIKTPAGEMLIVHLHVDVRDAMGANAINTMLEAITPRVVEITGGRALLRIISNLAVDRMVKAEAVWKSDAIGGEKVVDDVIKAYEFADNDQYRCTTHNKGIVNGIDALVIATGNDFRAIEAGAHSYAAMSGRYRSLTRYWKDNNGDLRGSIEMPMALATIGGATKTHPLAKVAIKILGVKSSQELACVAASLGLAQNFAALYAMVTGGIQKGHMKLHAYNIAVMAGAKPDQVDEVVKQMVESGKIGADKAKEVLERM